MLVNPETFQGMIKGMGRNITFGLVSIEPGFDPHQVRDAMEKALPKDVLVYERNNFIKAEQEFS